MPSKSALYTAQPAQELWTAEAYHQLALVDRYKTAAERALKRTLQNLDASRRLELREERHAISIQKRKKPRPSSPSRALRTRSRSASKRNGKPPATVTSAPRVVQKIMVSVTREGTQTEMTPSNDAILRQLDRKSPYPPEEVYRKFEFPQGMPSEYHCFTDREDYRRERGHTIEQWFSLDNWRELAAREEELGTGHALPPPEAFRFVKCAVSSPIDNPITDVFYWVTIRRHTVLLLALTCGGGAVYAQLANTTSLVGTVTDSAGAAMPDVSITAVNTATQDTYKTTTSSDGNYTIAFPRIGGYRIEASSRRLSDD